MIFQLYDFYILLHFCGWFRKFNWKICNKKPVQDQHNNNLAIIYFFDQELEDDLPDNYHNTTEMRTNVNGNDLDIKETIDKTTSDDRSERN